MTDWQKLQTDRLAAYWDKIKSEHASQQRSVKQQDTEDEEVNEHAQRKPRRK